LEGLDDAGVDAGSAAVALASTVSHLAQVIFLVAVTRKLYEVPS
jgi:hypothetical protein